MEGRISDLEAVQGKATNLSFKLEEVHEVINSISIISLGPKKRKL